MCAVSVCHSNCKQSTRQVSLSPPPPLVRVRLIFTWICVCDICVGLVCATVAEATKLSACFEDSCSNCCNFSLSMQRCPERGNYEFIKNCFLNALLDNRYASGQKWSVFAEVAALTAIYDGKLYAPSYTHTKYIYLVSVGLSVTLNGAYDDDEAKSSYRVCVWCVFPS